MTTYYTFQYNNGHLSMIVKDDKPTIYHVADLLNKERRYPVCIWIVKPKKEEA